MIKRILSIAVLTVVAVVAVVAALYLANGAPVAASVPSETAALGGKPYVVKIHAQWCPKCMMTKDVWSSVEDEYAGRVHFVVLDFTNERTSQASDAEVERLGLGALFEADAGTGSIVVLDAQRRAVTASITGSRNFAEYASAIDAALASASS